MKSMWMTAAAVVLGLVVTAQAASIAYVGIDNTSNGDWGSTSVIKPLDTDNYYGTSGWRVQGNYKAPAFATLNDPNAYQWYYGFSVDNPSGVPAATVGNVDVGIAYSQGPAWGNGNWADVWTVTLTQDATFGLCVAGWWTGNPANNNGLTNARVYLQSDPGNMVQATDAMRADGPDYLLFNITGAAGDVFVIQTQAGTAGWGHSIGLMLDPSYVPEPATMSLLALGGLAALIRRRK